MSDVPPSSGKQEAWHPQGFSAPKADGQTNEDAWQFSHKGVAALSDGASISFDSASWARILVRQYARDPCFDDAWLAAALQEFAALHDRESLSWVQQGAFDRGSFASLLGVRRWGARVEVLAIGDSIAVLCDADRVAATFPYESPEQFDQRPLLLSTNPTQNAFLAERDAKRDFTVAWDIGLLADPSVLCVSDALGHWIISHRNDEPSPIAGLRDLKTRRAFARFVAHERAAGDLRRDDTTMLACWGC
ncbi:MAG TPA: hypothetical protein VGG57_13835 [Stellaceae bacterium]